MAGYNVLAAATTQYHSAHEFDGLDPHTKTGVSNWLSWENNRIKVGW